MIADRGRVVRDATPPPLRASATQRDPFRRM
jgi:hypothetical protein